MTATCTHCDTTFPHVDCNEDGSPYIEAIRCASPGCEVYLCGATCQELSFACDACGLRFCLSHLVLIPDGTDRPLRCCPACAACCKPEIAPAPVARHRTMPAMAGCSREEESAYIYVQDTEVA